MDQKELIPMEKIRMANVPFYDELSVRNLWE
jgi:hypothetical protein